MTRYEDYVSSTNEVLGLVEQRQAQTKNEAGVKVRSDDCS